MKGTGPTVERSMRKISLITTAIVAIGFINCPHGLNPATVLAAESHTLSRPERNSKASGQKDAPSMDMDMNSGGMSPNANMPPGAPLRPIRYVMSPEAKMLAEVRTTPVRRQRAYKELLLAGMVFPAETRDASLSARIAGRLDKVFIDFTGVRVKKGDPMVTIWSPTLITSQVELFESIKSGDTEGVIRGCRRKTHAVWPYKRSGKTYPREQKA
jgi:hypothetical protein